MSKAISFLLLMLLIIGGSSFGQITNELTFEQLDSLQRIEKRPVLVFIHTSWCRYCRAMEHTTFQNKVVKELLEAHFYFIALDAEEKRDIKVRGHTFYYQPTGNTSGQHALAYLLGNVDGKLSLPTISILDKNYNIIDQYGGFLTARHLSDLLNRIHKLPSY